MEVLNGGVMTELDYMPVGGKTARGLAGPPTTPRPRRPQPSDFEEFFENGAIALHIVGAGTILHANRAELELLGYLPKNTSADPSRIFTPIRM
jgi:hypothetical protein